jgi:hypothetical protein
MFGKPQVLYDLKYNTHKESAEYDRNAYEQR